MSKKIRRKQASQRAEIANQFLRGFIATGLLAAMPTATSRKPLQLALRGAVAIAAGTAGSNALMRKNLGAALMATTIGACSLALTDSLFNRTITSHKDSKDE